MDFNKIDKRLDELMHTNGAIACGLIDWQSGMTLGTRTNGKFDIDLACAGNSEVIKSKMATMRSLGLEGSIKDILITLTDQIHIIGMVPDNPELALYFALDADKANLALARIAVQKAAK